MKELNYSTLKIVSGGNINWKDVLYQSIFAGVEPVGIRWFK